MWEYLFEFRGYVAEIRNWVAGSNVLSGGKKTPILDCLLTGKGRNSSTSLGRLSGAIKVDALQGSSYNR